MSVRKRPVITVVDARPMDQVGFRDSRAASGASEIPKLSPPPQKGPPVSRPPPPANLNTASADSDSIYGVPRKPASSENRIPSDLSLNKLSHPPPPKPRRAGEPRPVTIHVDGMNNNFLPDRPLHPPAQKPVALKRTSVHPEETTKDASSQNSPVNTATNDAWNANDWSLDTSASTKVKPEVAVKRPTIIRVSTVEAKSESGARPPPVASKSVAAKQHAAERLSAIDDTPSDSDGFAKPSTKPKPAVRPKPETGMDTDPIEDRPQPSADVRKRPTIIRPVSLYATSGLHGISASNPPSNSYPAGPNSGAPNALPRHFASSETPSEKVSAPTRVAPTIIRPGSGAPGSVNIRPELPIKQPEIQTRQQPEVPAKCPEKPAVADAVVAPQPKKRPNIIRPSVEVGRKVMPESTVTITSGTVHFSAVGTSASSPEHQDTMTSPDVPPEKQNAENWKRIEMDDRQSVAPTRPTAFSSHDPAGHDGVSRKPPHSELRQPPSKPPPPRTAMSSDVRKQNALDNSKSQSSDSVVPRHSGPPARPTAGPTTKPARPTQPTKRISSVADMAPSLPRRPTLGHPLFHYVVTGPHAIALFDYKPTQPDELQFNAGTVILLEKWINSEWLQGRTEQASGMFPSSFVDIIEAPAAANSTTVAPAASSTVAAESWASSTSCSGKGPRCCARFDYDGEDAADLAFASGDIIHLVEQGVY